MKRYHFEFIEADNPDFTEKDHIVFAPSLIDAIEKFEKKHSIAAPVFLDLPSFETFMEIEFRDSIGYIKYVISW